MKNHLSPGQRVPAGAGGEDRMGGAAGVTARVTARPAPRETGCCHLVVWEPRPPKGWGVQGNGERKNTRGIQGELPEEKKNNNKKQ